MAPLRWLVAWAVLVGALVAVRSVAGLDLPLGADAPRWALAATTVAGGGSPGLPPGGPALVALVAFIGAMEPWQAGGWVALAGAATATVLAAFVARGLGAPIVATGLAAAATAAAVFPFAFVQSPDALFACLLLGVVLVGLTWEAQPDDPRRGVLWIASAAVLPLVRIAGAIVLVAVLLAVLSRRWPRLCAELAVAFVVGAAWAADHVGLWPSLWARLLGAGLMVPAVIASGALTAVAAWAYARHKPYGQPKLPQPWALLTAMSPALAAPYLWPGPTDGLVFVPVAAVGLATGVAAIAERWPRLALPALAAPAAGLLAAAWPAPEALGALLAQRDVARDDRAVAEALAAQSGKFFLGGDADGVNVFLRWSRHDPELPPPSAWRTATFDGADWRTLWVAPEDALGAPFTAVATVGDRAIWRLAAADGSRPCSRSVPVDGVVDADGPVRGVVEPACAAPAFPPPAVTLNGIAEAE